MDFETVEAAGNTYARQKGIPLNIPKECTIVGLGGVGLWVAYLLAMSGVPNLVLIDDDKLEESNLNRLPCKPGWEGGYKVDIAEELIKAIRPMCNITKHIMRIDEPGKCTYLSGVVFCCTDKLPSQQLIHAACKKNGLLYQRAGYDGTILNVSRAFGFEFCAPPADEPEGYAFDPSWVIPAVMSAAAAVSSVLLSEVTLQDDISKLATIGSSVVPKPIRELLHSRGAECGRKATLEEIDKNPEAHIPEGYGTCDGCLKWDESDVKLESEAWAEAEVKKELAGVAGLGCRSQILQDYLKKRQEELGIEV